MKRNMDLVRNILLALESREEDFQNKALPIDGFSDDEISYHVKLMHQAGLIEAFNASHLSRIIWIPISMTWEGHEFLEASRDNTRWEKVKKLIVDKGGNLSYEVLKQALINTMKAAIFM